MKATKRLIAVTTGISIVLMAIVAGVAVGAMGEIVTDDAATTAHNLETNGSALVLSLVGWTIILLCDLAASWGIYAFFKEKSPKLAGITGGIRLVYSLILAWAVVQLFLASHFAPDLSAAQFVSNFYNVWGLGLGIFGFHLLGLGWLFSSKSWVTKVISLLIALAGFGYLIIYAGELLIEDFAATKSTLEAIFMLPMIAGELGFAIWLLVKYKRFSLS